MADIIEIERYADGIEIKYSDGTEEEIQAGQYQFKNSDGETVVERAATQDDIDRLNALAALFTPTTNSPDDDGTPDQGSGDAPGTQTSGSSTDDDGTPDQGSGDAPGTQTSGGATDDDGTPDQGSGDAPGTQTSGGATDDDGTPDQGSGDAPILAAKTAAEVETFESVSGTRGDDTIKTGASNDKILSGTGDDVIRSGGGDDNIRSGPGNDRIYSGSGDDDVRGGAGNDIILGGSGHDDLHGDFGNDFIRGGGGNDKIRGDAGNDRLFGEGGSDDMGGGIGRDLVNGGAGNDSIEGGLGGDILIGGGGSDKFEFDFVRDSGLGTLRDIIRDFTQGIDLIDLDRIDANAGLAGNQEFNFIGDAAFGGSAGELRYQKVGTNTLIEMDVNGDTSADSQILLNGSFDLTRFDFDL